MKERRVIIILLITCLSVFVAKSQNLPMTQQYSFDNMLLNPAFCGIGEGASVRLLHRQQWVGITNPPHTSAMLVNGRASGQPIGFGAYVYKDANGPNKILGFQATVAYHLLIASRRYNKTTLSVALSFHGTNNTLDETGFSHEFYDPIITYSRRSTFIPDFNAGIVFTMHGVMLGISADHLIPVRNKLYNHSVEELIPVYMNFHGGYVLKLPQGFKLNPLINVRTDYHAHSQMEVGGKLSYGYGKKIRSRYMRNPNEFWIGFNYRQTLDYLNVAPLCFQPMVGLKLGDFIFAYQFELALTPIQLHTYGTHQIMIGLKLFGDRVQDWGRTEQATFNEEF